ncbi:MAG TPA: hypothetical protein PKD77_02965 [Rudaea sp.]|jgi:hypothetical protein|nr:hypothetical protein [Rudaea sp.]
MNNKERVVGMKTKPVVGADAREESGGDDCHRIKGNTQEARIVPVMRLAFNGGVLRGEP